MTKKEKDGVILLISCFFDHRQKGFQFSNLFIQYPDNAILSAQVTLQFIPDGLARADEV